MNPKVGVVGRKTYYECTTCHQCFEGENTEIAISNINSWKQRGGDGYLPANNYSVIISSVAVGGIILLYLIGYVTLYRQGLLDNKKIKVIYKWLPRGNKNIKES